MTDKFSIGDHVTWNSLRGHTSLNWTLLVGMKLI